MSKRVTLFTFLFAGLLTIFSSSALTTIAPSAPRVVPQDPCATGSAFRDCQACGNAKSLKGKNLNVEKNRDDPGSGFVTRTVPEVRKKSNNTKFTADMAIELTGYVVSVEKGGFKEGCNCGRAELRDLHINVAAQPNEKNNNRRFVIVEITPRWQEKLGFDNSNYTKMLAAANAKFKGKWVTFRGWMLFDGFHTSESESTNPGGATNWRATPWEVHPVTSFEVLPGKPQ